MSAYPPVYETTHESRSAALRAAGWTFNPMDRNQTLWAYERLTGQTTW